MQTTEAIKNLRNYIHCINYEKENEHCCDGKCNECPYQTKDITATLKSALEIVQVFHKFVEDGKK